MKIRSGVRLSAESKAENLELITKYSFLVTGNHVQPDVWCFSNAEHLGFESIYFNVFPRGFDVNRTEEDLGLS